ncbi:MAG: serine protease [bacterium]|nr:serine protease [bacterium]
MTVRTHFGTVRRGSGYLFGSTGYVVVPFHLVSDASSIQVYQADIGVFTSRRVRRVEPRSNIAVLILDATQQIGTSFARLADSRNVKKGDVAYVLHHPVDGPMVEATTSVRQAGYARQMQPSFVTSSYAPEQPMIEVDGPFDSGSAGGLLLNENYDLMGLIVGGTTSGAQRTVAALASSAIQPLMNGTFTEGLDALRTDNKSDAAYFDKFLGASPQPQNYNSPMSEGYIAWFSPMQPVVYQDSEFTSEINDKIRKNWFCTTNLLIDGRPIREWSAGRLCILPASVNPWSLSDGAERLIHFDADSKFSKIIHKTRETEERIMTRYLLSIALPAGTHKLKYENKGANYKASGIKRKSITIEPGRAQLLDITGLSLVEMKLLPKNVAGVGEKQSVRYELERKPIGEREVGLMIRMNRFPVKF